MNTKKIIDYQEVTGANNDESFLRSIKAKFKNLEYIIETKEEKALKLQPSILKFNKLKQEFELLKKLKIGENYSKKKEFSLENWIGGFKYKHPLAYNPPCEKEKTISIVDIKSILKNYKEIYQELILITEEYKQNKQKLATLKLEVEKLQKNPDPTENKVFRIDFKNNIFELLSKGYVFQGSIDFNKGGFTQTMVKYKE
tara:strand:+ start:617 stop:1213 length:597 start_codon:yes stop_codon:yes gene_type:complete